MNKIFNLMSAIIVMMSAAVAQTTVSLLPASGALDVGTASSETVKVIGKGVGENNDSALKDAYRDAIERAVGLFVDAETQVKNDEVLKDSVLTFSNAYIEKYEIKKEESVGSLQKITIIAVVRKAALVKKVSGLMPVQNIAFGEDLKNAHAQMVTKENRTQDAVALVKNVFNDFDPVKSLMKVSLASTKPLIKDSSVGGADNTSVGYLMQISVDEEKYYKELMPKLKQVLEQISLSKPKKLRLTDDIRMCSLPFHILNGERLTKEEVEYMTDGEARWGREIAAVYPNVLVLRCHLWGKLQAWAKIPNDPYAFHQDVYYDVSTGRHGGPGSELFCCWRVGTGMDGVQYNRFDKNYKKQNKYVMMIENASRASSSLTAYFYEVDYGVYYEIVQWLAHMVGARSPLDESVSDSRELHGERKTVYHVVLKDASGGELAAQSFAVENKDIINFGIMQHNWFEGRDIFYITPFVSCGASSMRKWLMFNVKKDMLPKIASISIELAE